jgi:uncharacterized protein DUF6256
MAPTEDIWRRIVPPLVAAFAVFLAMVRVSLRHPEAAGEAARPTWGSFLRYLALTAGAGYLALLVIVLVFHVVLARDPGAFGSAAAGGAALLAIVLPLFVLSEWIARRIGR